jgi:hypothetical protein
MNLTAFTRAAGALVLVATAPCFSQNSGDTGVNALSKMLAKKQSLSDAQTFAGFCAALGKFTGKEGNTFTFQPRYYDLDKLIFRRNIDVDSAYRRTAWERNLQISVGLTPNPDRVLGTPKNCQLGFGYAIFNNKEIPLPCFGSLMQPSQTYFKFQSYLTAYISSVKNDTIRTMLRKIMNERCYSCLPEFLRDSVENKFGMAFEKMMERPRNLVDSLGRFLLRRPQLVAGITGINGFGNRGEAEVDLKTSFSSYLFIRKKPPIDPQINLSASLFFQDDSTRSHLNLNRKTLNLSPGVNIIFYSKVEFMPGVSYNQILSGIYADECRSTFCPTGSFFVKIAEKLAAGFNVSYDTNTKRPTANATLKASLD